MIFKNLDKLKHHLSFISLSKYNSLKKDFEFQSRENFLKEERLNKIKKELRSVNEELRKEKKTVQEMQNKILEKNVKLKKIGGKVGRLTFENKKLKQSLADTSEKLDSARKELRTRPRANLQSLINYHEKRK